MAAAAYSPAVLQQTVNVLALHKGNQTAAAAAMRMPRPTFVARMFAAKARGFKPNGKHQAADDPQHLKGQIKKLESELKAAKALAATAVEAPGLPIDRKNVERLRRQITAVKGPVRYVITAAQNATPIHEPFFQSLLTYCRHNNAQLLVIPYRYKNPTAHWAGKAEDDDWWDTKLHPYMFDERVNLNKNLMLLADIKTQPTAVTPLTGLEGFTGVLSGIVGHPKLELTTVPTPQSRMAKIMTTTGAVTRKNYLPAKAGKKGEFHHTFGACVVEVDGPTFHPRQINAVRDGSFQDLTLEYDGDIVREGGVAAVIMGDSHLEFVDPEVVRATFGPQGILDTLRPKHLVWHDVHDFYSRNHHHIHEPFIEYVKAMSGTDDVSAMLDKTFQFIDEQTRKRPWLTNVFVPSNHPDALAKWVKRADWKTDPRNAKFLLETTLAMLESAKMGESGAQVMCPFTYWAKKRLTTAAQSLFLKRDQGFVLRGIELGYHGDTGANGARGSRLGFSKIGVKVVIGHSHSPGIRDGAYQTGTNSRLNLEYSSGASSWMHTDCLVYENGKRTLLNIIGGEWKL